MAYPKREITGQLYTAGGDVVVAGTVTAYIVPQGARVPDTGGGGVYYKVGALQQGVINYALYNTTGIRSFYATALTSVQPTGAYYKVHYEIYSPVTESWFEVWSIEGSGALDIGALQPIEYGPELLEGFRPLKFAYTIGETGAVGAPGGSQPTIVQSLPTVTTSMLGFQYQHDRSPNNEPDQFWQVMRTGGGTLYYHFMMEAED
jgi:hypothetical protein